MSSTFYGPFSVQKWPFFGLFSGRSDLKLTTIAGVSSARLQSGLLFFRCDEGIKGTQIGVQ